MRNNLAARIFFWTYAGAILLGITAVWLTDKGDVVLWCAENRNLFFNQFFKHLTFLGDGVFLAVFCLFSALVRYKYSLILTMVGLCQLVITAILKRKVFGNLPRPRRYFDPAEYPVDWQIEGVAVHGNYSFPSGHTVTAFGLALFVVLMSGKRWVGFFMACLAVLVGFSRVYIFQHFLVDVIAGSIVGVIITYSVFYLAQSWHPFWEHQRLHRSPLGIDWR